MDEELHVAERMMTPIELRVSAKIRKPKLLHGLTSRGSRGVTLIDSVVGSALMLLVFVGIAAAFQLSLDVVTNNKIRAGAIALVNERIEYLRSLSYNQIGVAGGIPPGIVPQIETVTWNAVPYTRRTSVLYSDDPEDGIGAADQNGITADYKTIRVEVSWESREGERNINLVGRVSPVGIETEVPGGTLTIYVVNAAAVSVSDTQVDIINTETTPAISIRTYTNSEGLVSFIGAPAASNYQITVSRPGYSSAETYPVTVENPDPNPRHLTVADNQTTSSTFAIDTVSTKTVETYKKSVPADWSDSLDTTDFVLTTSNVDVLGGEAILRGEAPYTSPGSLRSISIAPSLLLGWDSLSWEDTEPPQTEITYRVYDASNTLIPDSDLSGNSGGFTLSPVDLTGISPETYSALRLEAELGTNDPDVTPSLDSWSISYDYGPVPFPNFSFLMRGSKAIGNNPTIYKYDETHSSGVSSSVTLQNLEWDTYALSVATTTGYNLAESCNPQPEVLAPGTSQATQLYVLPYTIHTLLVDVRTNAGLLLSGASVRLYKTGYDETQSTSSCGQVFFEDLTLDSYTIEVSKVGYQTESSTVNVSDVSLISILLNAL